MTKEFARPSFSFWLRFSIMSSRSWFLRSMELHMKSDTKFIASWLSIFSFGLSTPMNPVMIPADMIGTAIRLLMPCAASSS